MSNYETYESPFCTRYASKEMQYLFSAQKKFSTFRKLWVALARAEMKLGLGSVTQAQVNQLEEHIDDIDFELAAEEEKRLRHDVMAHVHTYGACCPDAKGIIHLGATSCYVGDNTDVIIMRDAMQVIRRKLINVLNNFAEFADSYKNMPCLAYTHLQPAQLTTVGKRATLWMNDLLMDLEDLEYQMGSLKLLGQKGTTGTQASFMELFEGDGDKVTRLEKMIAEEMGFEKCVPVSGQTYSRKVDSRIVNVLAGIAESCSKFSCDLRLLASFKEMEEPFGKSQIGSSAMPYKRNPMRAERITALSRYLMVDMLNPAFTAGTQWFERTLDDSANKRIAVAEAFLAADAILNIMLDITSGIVVYPKVIRSRVMRELPFMATENIMMSSVKKGGDRQDLHERIRQHSVAAGKIIKEEGGENDLIDRIAADPAFNITKEEILEMLVPENFTGRSAQQVDEFLKDCIRPILDSNKDLLGETAQLSV